MKKCVSLLLSIITLLGTFVYVSNANSYSYIERSLYNNVLQGRNSIVGFVFTGGRQPVSNIYVELLTDTYSTISRVKTTGAGFYSFPGLADGNYIIKILPLGTDYEEQTQSISLVSISVIAGRGATSEQVDFYLKVKRNANSGPLAAPGVIFAQDIPKDAQKLYEEGINYLRDKKEKEGFEKLKSSIEIFPQYYSALDRLGTEYVVRGYYYPAFVLLTKAVEINPRSFSSSFGLGLASFRLQQVDKAIENLRRATEIYNKSANAYLWLGIALHQNKNLPQTEAALIQANKLSKGESAEIHWQLARLYKDQKRFRESADELELFLKYKSDAKDAEKIKQTIITLRQKANGN